MAAKQCHFCRQVFDNSTKCRKHVCSCPSLNVSVRYISTSPRPTMHALIAKSASGRPRRRVVVMLYAASAKLQLILELHPALNMVCCDECSDSLFAPPLPFQCVALPLAT